MRKLNIFLKLKYEFYLIILLMNDLRKKRLQIVGITAFILWLAMFFPQLNNLIESKFDLLIRLSTFLIWISSLVTLNVHKD